MKKLALALAATSLISLVVPTDQAAAQNRPNGYGQQHPGWGRDNRPSQHRWRRGQRMGYNDWHSARAVDYRSHHLRAPPRGYVWREQNGQFILGAIATGVIASIILQNNH